ncbi:hypothetical protein V6Z12_D01G001400 [Gossypium hirsutum]
MYATQLSQLQEMGFYDTREYKRTTCYCWKCPCCDLWEIPGSLEDASGLLCIFVSLHVSNI